MSRNVQAGNEITLRVSFRNDLGAVVEATGVTLSIFEPNVDVSILANAIIQNVAPIYLGNGIFEYKYTVGSSVVAGTWTDKWSGTIGVTPIAAEMTFEVTTGGFIVSADSQLYKNNIITITLPPTIKSLDGVSLLSQPYSFSYMTNINPAYTDIRKVRLEVGAFITSITDHTLQTAILEASLDADSAGLGALTINDNYLIHARREYTTCLASKILLTNLLNSQLKSKSLDNLTVAYDTTGVKGALSKIDNCLARWGAIITPIRHKDPKMVVKGSLDPDRPVIGRGWSNQTGAPLVNTKGYKTGSRRAVGIHTAPTHKWR